MTKEYKCGNAVVKIHGTAKTQKDDIKQACALFAAALEADKRKVGA